MSFNIGDTVRPTRLQPFVEMFTPEVLGAQGEVEEIHDPGYWHEDDTEGAVFVYYPGGEAGSVGDVVAHRPAELELVA